MVTGLVLSSDHKYTLDGRPVPGVTSILKSAGLVDLEWATQWHLDKGQAIHKAMELYVLGRLDWTTVDDRIIGFIRAGVKFLKDAGCDFSTAEPEVMVASRRYGYAGKLDLVATLFGQRRLADWKSGAMGAVRQQTAGYEMAYREERGGPILPRIALKLNADGTYKMKELADFSDYLDWLECLEKFRTKDGE